MRSLSYSGVSIESEKFNSSLSDEGQYLSELLDASRAFVVGLRKRYGGLQPLDISLTDKTSIVTRDELQSGTRLRIVAFFESGSDEHSHDYMIRKCAGVIDPVRYGASTLIDRYPEGEVYDRLTALMIAGAMLDL